MKSKVLLSCLFFFFSTEIFSQQQPREFSVLFYNVENLFDLKDDPETLDEEFTPGGDRRWNYNRLNQKLLNISKVILSASGWEPPQIIALCEIENRFVLEQLLTRTPLQSFPYRIIHKESPDHRGTDVAIIYNEEVFYPLEYRYFPLKTEQDSVLSTREILYVSGIINQTDTIYVFANHWPSRYSGLLESQPLRNLAAKTLKTRITQLQEKRLNPKIIITGDFNDQPADESVSVYLGALKPTTSAYEPSQLYNLSATWAGNEFGTIKYQSQWSVFDQIIVSGTLLDTDNKMFTRPEWAQIVQLPFLLEPDERYGGIKTNRTYIGFRYHGGFSDHLPVLLKLQVNH